MKRIDIIALFVAITSLGWQIFNAINQNVSKLETEIDFIRSANNGKIELKCITRNIGYKPIYLDTFELRCYKQNGAETYNSISWSRIDTASKIIEAGQSMSASLEFKNMDELRKFFLLGKRIVILVITQSGKQKQYEITDNLKQQVIGNLEMVDPSVNFTFSLK